MLLLKLVQTSCETEEKRTNTKIPLKLTFHQEHRFPLHVTLNCAFAAYDQLSGINRASFTSQISCNSGTYDIIIKYECNFDNCRFADERDAKNTTILSCSIFLSPASIRGASVRASGSPLWPARWFPGSDGYVKIDALR